MATTFVWMRHPATGGAQKFAAAAVEEWRKAGWEPCDPPAEQNPAIGPNHPMIAEPEEPLAASPPAEVSGADQAPDKKSNRRAPAEDGKE